MQKNKVRINNTDGVSEKHPSIHPFAHDCGGILPHYSLQHYFSLLRFAGSSVQVPPQHFRPGL